MSKSKKNTAHEAFIIGRIREVRIDQNLSAERSVTPSVTTFNRSPVLRRHGRLRKHERTTFVRMPRVSFVGSARVVADLFLRRKPAARLPANGLNDLLRGGLGAAFFAQLRRAI